MAQRFRLVSLDLRGHGGSDWPGVYSLQLMADDVVGVLDHLNLNNAVLLGHSMGGCVAYLIAEQSPSRIRFLIIEDMAPPFVRERRVPQRPDDEVDFDWAVAATIVEEVGLGDPTSWDRLSTITAPTLLLGGGPASHIPQERLRQVLDAIPSCTLVTIPAGHLVHASRPNDFTDAIFEWLDQTTAV